jgi:hypothetical protein
MFFEKELDNALRLGDVVQGYILTNPFFKEPFSLLKAKDMSIQSMLNYPIIVLYLHLVALLMWVRYL